MADFHTVSAGVSAIDLQGTALPSSRASSSKQLAHAASEFESILLSQWLQGAESSFGSMPGADDEQDAGDEQMKSFAVQALAKGFTVSGGIGLASIVTRALAHDHTTPDIRKESQGSSR